MFTDTYKNKAVFLEEYGTRYHDREGARFLVVEDDISAQPVLEKIIKMVDHKAVIRWSRSAEWASILIEEQKSASRSFDFIIADVLLSGEMTGLDLWKKYGEDDSLFLFTSSLSLDKFSNMVGEDSDKFPFLIQKPINPIKCIESIKALKAFKNAFQRR